MYSVQLCLTLFVADLQFALLQDFEDYVILLHVFAKCFGEIVRRGNLAFGYIQEDVRDLQDIVKIFLSAIAVFKDFVLVARYFESLLSYMGLVRGTPGNASHHKPFLMRTRDTFVSLI
jgi:hypothetical protein